MSHPAPVSGSDPYDNRRYAIKVPAEVADLVPTADRLGFIERKGFAYDVQPSVTSIEAAVTRPALENWKRNRLVEWIVDHLSEVAESMVMFDKEVVAPGVLRRADDHKPEADLGTRVHAHLERFAVTGELADDIPPPERPFVDAGVDYWVTHVAEAVAVEAVVWHPGAVGYAGRIDNLVRDRDGRLILCDWKTSQSHDAPWRAWSNHSRQQLCYARAPWIYLDRQWQPMPEVRAAHLVYLTADGKYAARDADLSDRTWADFLTIRRAYDLAFPKWKA